MRKRRGLGGLSLLKVILVIADRKWEEDRFRFVSRREGEKERRRGSAREFKIRGRGNRDLIRDWFS